MHDYVDRQGRDLLEHNRLSDFDDLWELEVEWFEPLNHSRGGWSGVARIELQRPDGGMEAVFLKRQENHTRRTWRHPFGGEPTFASEMDNMKILQDIGVPSLQPLYYGQRKVNGVWRAILVTRELLGFVPLNVQMQWWQDEGWADSFGQRRALINVVADTLRRLHKNRVVHNALYPKHIFVSLPEHGSPEMRLIDLEKMRRTPCVGYAARRDLDSLNRRSIINSQSDRMRFLQRYLKQSPLSASGKRMWRRLAINRINFIRKQQKHA
jgi:hypothetical protein